MTETRKKIIDIIKDYMDKTLGFGCLIKTLNKGIYKTIEKRVFDDGLDINIIGSDDESCASHYIIIGHYDITAVLRYIMNNEYYVLNNPNSFDVRGKGIVDGKEYNDVYYGLIPNKPLHLFTEKEEEELLKLLKSLENHI